VFRIEAGRARLRPVQVGVITDQSAQVLGGLAVGDPVILFPSDDVKPGVRVKASGAKG
jgi:HlyD family secretion protein